MLSNWLQHIEFAYPWILPLLLIVPYLIFWHIRSHRKQTAALTITTTHFIQHTQNWKTTFRYLPLLLRCIAIAAFIVAIARPRQKFTEQQTEGEGIDIVLCFDISGSMTEQDFTPNRLEASKAVASKFVEGRPGDKIGIVIFSSQSFTLCPVTTDHNAVLAQISNIENGYLQEEGTAIGSGLATSVDRLKDSKSKSKVIILLTDGVDFGGQISPDIAMNMAKLYGIRVYTIGVGSNKSMDVQVQSMLGTTTQTRKMEFNEGLLKQLATQTGGQYFHATDNEALKKIYDSINLLEKSKVEITTYDRYTEEFLPLVLIGLACIIIELLLRLTVFRKFP
ncbi:MAG: VWA domain-containing protein [Bacteroidota bacterium]|nr:VWA domain-containing protein [Bacteroidota bacterium]